MKFNLTTDPWIGVLDNDYNVTKVSLNTLFENLANYKALNNETPMQDLVILRMLIAINISNDNKNGVLDYLKRHQSDFDVFGPKPFNSIPNDLYNSLVSKNHDTTSGKGQLTIKQINRQISESSNTPAVLSNYGFKQKDELELDSLVRWLMVYQQYSGSTDKIKLEHDLEDKPIKYKAYSGWLEKISSIIINGDNLEQTLQLNTPKVDGLQKPVWEYNQKQYLQKRLTQTSPSDTAELLTLPSRVFTLIDNAGKLEILTALLPKLDDIETGKFEFMSLKRFDKKLDTYKMRSKTKFNLTLEDQFWRLLPEIVNKDTGIDLTNKTGHYISTIGYINDGNASSQLPFKEVHNSFYLQTDYQKQLQVINDLNAIGDAIFDATLRDDYFNSINFDALNVFADSLDVSALYNSAVLTALRLGRKSAKANHYSKFVKDIYTIVKGHVNDDLFNPYSY